MASISAREMLSQLPLRMADGGEAVERSGAYRRAFEQNGEDGVQAYYASLREVAQTYLADTDAPTGAEAYNIMVESGISTTDLINAGVGQDVLTKIFTITEDPSTPTYGVTAAESAFIRNPVLAAEAARRSAEGLDGVADLQQQARDYVADIKEGGITDAERAEMQRIATERGITVQDFIDTGVDTGILFKGTYCPPGSKLEGQPIPADGNCNPDVTPTPTTKVCPTGTARAGETIPIADDCDATTTPTTKVCPAGSVLAGQTVAYDADCDPTTKVCPAGTLKAGKTIPFADDCNAEDPLLCPTDSKLAGEPVPADGDCNPPDLCPAGTELAGLPVPTDGDCNPTTTTKLCPTGTQLEGQPMPANGDCNPNKFPTTQVCPAGTELEGQEIPIEDSCNPTVVGGGGSTAVTVYGQTKVCPAGTALEGMTIAQDADCNDTTTKATKDPGTYAPGVPAIDTAFRESAPRTQATYDETQADGTVVTKNIPGQFNYTPAAKLMPATGSGLSWTPPGVTSRPRSLLSPETVRDYGGFTSASQRFAQNRRNMDQGILGAFREANVYDPSAIREFRQQARAGLFSDDAGFNLDQFKTAFDNWLSTRSATGGTDTTDTSTDTITSNWWNRGGYGGGDPFTDADRSGAYGQGEMGDWPSGEEMGYFGPITPVDLRYGVPGVFAKGGPVNKSARAMLAEFSNGGAVNANRTPLSPDDPLYIHEGTPSASRLGTASSAEMEFLRQNLPQPQGTQLPADMYRADGSIKSDKGFLGPVQNAVSGKTMTELSIGIGINGQEMEVPSMVPTLTPEEIEILRTNNFEGRAEDIPESIMRKAKEHAEMRIKQGLNPFYQDGEEGADLPRNTNQTESASMLESIIEGASMIPETVGNYFVRPNEAGGPSLVSPRQVGSDLKTLGGTMWGAAKEAPLSFLMDILPIIGEIRSGADVDKFTDLANEAEAAGDTRMADIYRQIVTLSAAGALPLAGMGARAARRGAISSAEEAATTSARRMLDDVAEAGGSQLELPETGRPIRAEEYAKDDFKNVTRNMYRHQDDINTPQEMHARAERIGPSFQDDIRNITNDLGLEKAESFGVKPLKSLTNKLKRGYELGEVTDAIRTRIIVNTAEEAEQAARRISDIMPTQDRGWQKIPTSGYFDRKLNVLYTSPNGERLLGEIQITTPEMIRASEGTGHRLYEVERALIERYGDETLIPSTHIRRFENMRRAQQELYDGVADTIDPAITDSIIDRTTWAPAVREGVTTQVGPTTAATTSARGAL